MDTVLEKPMSVTFPESIFRAYDIRGIVDTELTVDLLFNLGRALGSFAQQQGQTSFIVARDGRLSSETFAKALTDGLLKTGIGVIDIGMVPSPLMYFATKTLSTQSGAIITGSHNPANYNGVKMIVAGKTLVEQDIQHLKKLIIKQNFLSGSGQYQQHAITEKYIARITQEIKLVRPLKIVIDCGNGVAGLLAAKLFTDIGCEVIELYCDVDGRFPNHHPDPSVKANVADLIAAVEQHKADIGLAFDGDADRLGVITNKGDMIWPDRQMMLFSQAILAEKKNGKIVYDVKCSAHLADVIEQAGGIPIMAKTGHSLIKAKLIEEQALLAGEMSGHIFFNDRWYGFDDALYSGCRLLEILAKQSLDSDNVFQQLPDSINTPELKLFLDEEYKFSLMNKLIQQAEFPGAKIITIDGLRIEYPHGWGLVRPSNTTPCLVLRFEADTDAKLDEIKELFRAQLLKVDSGLDLPF